MVCLSINIGCLVEILAPQNDLHLPVAVAILLALLFGLFRRTRTMNKLWLVVLIISASVFESSWAEPEAKAEPEANPEADPEAARYILRSRISAPDQNGQNRRIYDFSEDKYYDVIPREDVILDSEDDIPNDNNQTSADVELDASGPLRCGVTTCPPITIPPVTHTPYPPTHPTHHPTHPTHHPTHPTHPPTHPTWPPTHPTHPPTHPTHPPTHPPTWPPTPTPHPPHCPSGPHVTTYPTLPSITYSNNCDYCDHDLYTLTCIPDAMTCASKCAGDWRCTHFTYISNLHGGTCRLKKAVGSGGAWATSIPAPSPYVCGYIPKRAFTSLLLNLCLGLDISVGLS